MAELPKSARIVIIGGGVIGLSCAYHLAKLGAEDVILLERHQLTSGTSWHAAGIIGPLRASMNLTKLAVYATELLPAIEAETGQATGYKQTGGFWLAQTEERMCELRRIADIGDMAGLTPEILTPDEIGSRLSLLNTRDITGGMWVAEDGQANPVDVCMAYAKGARDHGAQLCEGVSVATVHTQEGAVHSVETSDGHTIRCEKVLNCAGAWAHELGKTSGVAVPLQAVEHMYVVTEPITDLPQPFPILRDLEGRIYIKEDAGKLVLGGFEADAKIWRPDSAGPDAPFLELPEDWDQFGPFMEAGLNRIPTLSESGIQHFMVGPESFTPDTKQVMGEAPECQNYFVAAGFNSIGIISSAGVGKVMAEWVTGGAAPLDLWDLDIARFEPHHNTPQFLDARVQEAVASQFEMHWPYKQMKTGRDLNHTPFHEAFAARGAVFGAPTGWERPLFFAPGETLHYSYGAQSWWPHAEREVKAMSDRAALLELSPFGKFKVEGRDAAAFLQRLCAADVDGPEGQITYTPMLNARGGMEADLTVTRLSDTSFMVVSGAATRRKDLTWMQRAIRAGEDVAISDITEDRAVLGLMGPAAREVLSRLTADDLSDEAFPLATSRKIQLGHTHVRASRLSYVGELGWELYIRAAEAAKVMELFADANLAALGLFAIDSCRMEKGFRHWGHDLGPEDTPLEAGLGFTVAWEKSGGFTGLEALQRQKAEGLERRILLFEAGPEPLLLHEEPVLRGGEYVGRTTSGARGLRTGKNLCFANVTVPRGEPLSDTLNASYEIIVAGERHPLTPL
ncbi:MAG: FAD-dependent oxidoreductase, partial [Pseudomonadota bacterium]